jgi:galactokinase
VKRKVTNAFSEGEIDLFVPGRVCLFGEHADWAGGYRRIDSSITEGYCLVVGTTQGIYARVDLPDSWQAGQHPSKLRLRSAMPDGKVIGPLELEMRETTLLEIARTGGFFSYCAGVAYYALLNHGAGGLAINSYKMDLPIRKGLSSSAAICVLLARAFNRAYDLKLTTRGEMELAYRGEIVTPSRCGRMDQACAYGRRPVFLTFDGDEMQIELLAPAARRDCSPVKDIYMVIVDLCAGKNTKKILADLNSYYPNGGGKIGADVRYYLGPVNKEILFKARDALTRGDAEELGKLMNEAQELFDQFVAPGCPSELAAPKLHKVLNLPEIQELIYGGKGVGSQGDGCAQFVARGPDEQRELMERLITYDVVCFNLEIRTQHDTAS